MLGSSGVAERLAASQEGLRSVELVSLPKMAHMLYRGDPSHTQQKLEITGLFFTFSIVRYSKEQ
jgi:hypothetical protein